MLGMLGLASVGVSCMASIGSTFRAVGQRRLTSVGLLLRQKARRLASVGVGWPSLGLQTYYISTTPASESRRLASVSVGWPSLGLQIYYISTPRASESHRSASVGIGWPPRGCEVTTLQHPERQQAVGRRQFASVGLLKFRYSTIYAVTRSASVRKTSAQK